MTEPLDPKVREAVDRLRKFSPHARLSAAMSSAQTPPGAKGAIFIGYKNPDGSGRTTASFESDSFCDDIDTLIRALDPSPLSR